jgi:hypothetical protein
LSAVNLPSITNECQSKYSSEFCKDEVIDELLSELDIPEYNYLSELAQSNVSDEALAAVVLADISGDSKHENTRSVLCNPIFENCSIIFNINK